MFLKKTKKNKFRKPINRYSQEKTSSDSNEIRTHNHLVRTRTLNHFAKLRQTKWLWVWILLLQLKLQIWCLPALSKEFLDIQAKQRV